MPGWVNNHDYGANPRVAAEDLLTRHIRTVTTRYHDNVTVGMLSMKWSSRAMAR
jgi:GH35 family endo-1,4-beta-xylanase